MILDAVLLDRTLTNDDIIIGMVRVFAVDATDVWVTVRSNFVPCPETTRVLCETESLVGDFKLEMEIILRDESLVPDDTVTVLRQLCGLWQCQMLMAD